MINFFDIKSVAIVWASEHKWKLWNSMLEFLQSFPWNKYWVNPKWGSFSWVKFYESISKLPEVVDILVFVIPAKIVPDSLTEAGKMGIKRAIIISAWFKEVWNYSLEEEVKEIAKKYDISILWPNCLWYIDTYKDLNLSFGSKKINKWNISVISQSGAMAVAITDWALSNNLWFSKIISLWNKAWIDEVDLLLALENDKNTKLIVLYLESLERGNSFLRVAKKLAKKKPIIILKSGISKKWEAAAVSHTGAVSSDKDIMFSVFKEAGLHYTNNLDEFFLWIEIFSKIDYKKVSDNLVVITNAWWIWVITSDYTEEYNINLLEFDEEEKNILMGWLPSSSSVSNPLDIIWDATSKTYLQILTNLKKIDKEYSILVLLTAQSITDVENISEVLSNFVKKNKDITLLTSFVWWEWVLEWINILLKNNILNYSEPWKAINSFSRLLKQKQLSNAIDNIEKEEIIEKTFIDDIRQKIKWKKWLLTNDLLNEVFDRYKINFVKEILVKDESEIEKVFVQINSEKLIAKINSDEIAHKTDIGGVILNIKTLDEAKKAYNDILNNLEKYSPDSKINWVNFWQMFEHSWEKRELFLWFKRDINFWNITVLWMWWIYVDIFEDIKIIPFLASKEKILDTIKTLRYYPILKWYRWQKSINFDSLVDIIYKLQFVFRDMEEIKEIDINPIICDEKESIIVDAKLYLK